MTDQKTKESTGVFKALSVLAILWNLMGVLAFAAQMFVSAEDMAKLPAEQQFLYSSIPAYANIAFAVAVFGGLFGSIGLIMRKSWSSPLLIASLTGIILQQSHMYFFSDTMKVMGPSAAIMPTVVLIIAIALIPFSRAWTISN